MDQEKLIFAITATIFIFITIAVLMVASTLLYRFIQFLLGF